MTSWDDWSFDGTIQVEEIVRTPRTLQATWTREAQEDLRAVHNIQAEAVLTEMIASAINEEIDAEILNDFRMFLRPNEKWIFPKVNWKKEGF